MGRKAVAVGFVLIGILLVTTACTANVASQNQGRQDLFYFQTLAAAPKPVLQAEGSGYQYGWPQLVVATVPEDVSRLQEIFSAQAVDQLRQVDFSRQLVVAVFQGMQSQCCSRVDINGVVPGKNMLTIYANVTTPSNPTPQANSPYHVIAITRPATISGDTTFRLVEDGKEVMRVNKYIPPGKP